MAESADESKPPVKTRSPLEKAVVWGGIVLLGVLVFLEYNSQKNYNAAHEWAMDNDGKRKPMKEVTEAMSGARMADAKIDGEENAKRFSWPSLFKTYEFIATFDGVGDDAACTSIYNPQMLEEVEEEMNSKFSTETTGSSAPDVGRFGQDGPEDNSPGEPGLEEATESDADPADSDG